MLIYLFIHPLRGSRNSTHLNSIHTATVTLVTDSRFQYQVLSKPWSLLCQIPSGSPHCIDPGHIPQYDRIDLQSSIFIFPYEAFSTNYGHQPAKMTRTTFEMSDTVASTRPMTTSEKSLVTGMTRSCKFYNRFLADISIGIKLLQIQNVKNHGICRQKCEIDITVSFSSFSKTIMVVHVYKWSGIMLLYDDI